MNITLSLPLLMAIALVSTADDALSQISSNPARNASLSSRTPTLRIRVWYVDSGAPGGGNGRSWGGAFIDLQQALFQAQDGDQVWVAAGTYVPAPPGGSQSATFPIQSGVEVYGGFVGNELQLSQRNPIVNTTILSGDINGDDTTSPVFNIGTGNSWNIVTFVNASSATRVDGFRLETGHLLNATAGLERGAGMHLENSSPTIANCSFSYCVGTTGGALWSDTGSPVIEDCSFSNNYSSAGSSRGGAIASEGGVMTVRNSVFTSNTAESYSGRGTGGAISNSNGVTHVSGCTFTNNLAFPRFGNSYTVSLGGAIYVDSGSVRIDSSRFIGNQSSVGGAVATSAFGTPLCQIYNSVFDGNVAASITTSGGFSIGAEAGAIWGAPNATMDIIGCVVHGGTADNKGGASVEGLGTVSSSIFWGNSDNTGTIGRAQVKASRVEYSCVMNMLVGEPGEDAPDPLKFPGSVALDPLFVSANAGNFRLRQNSPCVDAGQNPAWPLWVTTDLDGYPRFVDDLGVLDTGVGPAPVVDMGSYERQ